MNPSLAGKWSPLGKVLEQRKESFTVDEEMEYQRVTVQLHARGIVPRDRITGSQLKTKRQQPCRGGDFLVAEIDAKVGGFGIVPPALAGAIVSSHYFLFGINEAEVSREYLGYFIRTRQFKEQVVAKGSTNYASIRPADVLRYRIPLRPIPEQQEIVRWLDGLATRVAGVQTLRNEMTDDATAFVARLHLKLAGPRRAKLSEVFDLHEIDEPIVPTGSYSQVGIREFGGGLFQKGAVVGTGTTYRTFHRLYPDAIVLSQVKGWEGAIAVAGPELDGWFASPEYRTFRCKPESAHPDYMRALLPSPWFIEQLRGLSRGQGARRQRTRPEQFLALELPMPTVAQQETALKVFSQMRGALKSLPEENDLPTLLPSALAQVFGG